MIMMNSDLILTTIKLSSDSRDRLRDYGKKGETYEDILIKLMDNWDANHDKE